MPQSFDAIILYLVFSTREQKPFLHDDIRQRMHAYLANIGREQGSQVYRVGGITDHVHLALSLARTMPVSDLVRELKTESSKWAKTIPGNDSCRNFAWQSGYGVCSLSKSHLPDLEAYIASQEQQHQTRSFQEAFLHLLRKHELEWDEAYVWD